MEKAITLSMESNMVFLHAQGHFYLLILLNVEVNTPVGVD